LRYFADVDLERARERRWLDDLLAVDADHGVPASGVGTRDARTSGRSRREVDPWCRTGSRRTSGPGRE
jgi:hypothetical protein